MGAFVGGLVGGLIYCAFALTYYRGKAVAYREIQEVVDEIWPKKKEKAGDHELDSTSL